MPWCGSVSCHPLAHTRWKGTAACQIANPPTAPSVGGVDSPPPLQLHETGLTPPIGEVKNAMNDNHLSLTPPTLSGI